MWLFTPIGFYSVVAHPGSDALVVRARALIDLEQLRDLHLPDLEILETPDRDYRWRTLVARDEWEHAAARMAVEIDYPNFKAEVARRQGHERAHRYGQVWSVMFALQSGT